MLVTSPRPRIGVLAVQGDVADHLRVLNALGVDARTVRRPEELAEVDGLVLPGGESTTIDRLLRIFDLAEPLRARLRAGMPAYGSCAGMIMLGSAVLDGRTDQGCLAALDISVRRNAFGRQVDSFEADLEIAALPRADEGPFRAVFIRAPWVERVGPGVEVLATVEHDGAERVVMVRQGPVLATSFHPEVTPDARVHELFVQMVREQAGSIGDRSGPSTSRSKGD
ncbi:pyridoxal 5'-phosphate synthase glutaminase subunit PdxT [Ornithinicoccus hortensis]|uniref:pyridoxal 5'-phosphate synthase glutaminase subunit PdxT n=1 Tax=Ornithinicoccus hortensis TaxID=82346 RepID=UPI00114FF13D|nr:pyridoxal 5'-phosphate synthase glutaminase subunit PdxT [Ornithinicoccus hortensis]